MHAMALDLLAPKLHGDGATVLDVGCGSGYLTACFHRMVAPNGGRAFGIDYLDELTNLSKSNISKDDRALLRKHNGIYLETKDGWEGLPQFGPFDAIHVSNLHQIGDSTMEFSLTS